MTGAGDDDRPWGLIALLTALVVMGQMSQSLYIPSMPYMDEALNTSRAAVKLTMAAFMVPFALAQLVFGPVSDRFGRRPAILGGMAIYVAASALCTVAPSIEVLISARFLQGVGACSGIAIFRAVVRDRFAPQQGARVLSYIGMGLALSPAVGPLIGGVLQDLAGWRANFAAQLVIAVCFLAWVHLRLPESNAAPDPAATDPARILRCLRQLLGDRVFVGYMAVVGTTLAGLFVYMTALPFVFIDEFGFAASSFGTVFIFTVAGYLIGSWVSSRLAPRLAPERVVPVGASICLAAGAAMFALTVLGRPTPAGVVGPMMLYMVGFGLVMPNSFAAGMAGYPHIAGTASSLFGCTQMGLGALGALLVALLPGSPATVMASLIVAVAIAAFAAFLVLVQPRRPA